MKIIYLDSDFKCHVIDNGTMISVETDFFDNKCDTFIEGYRFVPAGESWIRKDGVEFRGEMVAPHVDYTILAAHQQQYEIMQAELNAAYQEGVNSI